MSTIVVLNGIPYLIPETGDVGWGTEVHNYLVALGTGSVISLEGGNFPLQSELNVGPNYGIASAYFRSGQNPAATAGVLRLTNTESIQWRNSTNTGNLSLNVVGNQLYFNGQPIGSGGGSVSPLTTKGDLYTFSTANARLPVGLNGQVLIADSSTATGLAWGAGGGGGGGSVVGFTFTDANGVDGTVLTPNTTPTLSISLGAITPTSVTASGIVSGSNISGSSSGTNTGDQTITLTGDVTGSGTGTFAVTYNGVVPILKGGTGQTTANAAFNALAPSQAGHAGQVLITDGSNTSWVGFPGSGSVTSVSATGNNGVTATVTNQTTTPNVIIGLGNITPTSVAATGNVTGANIGGTTTGTNTGDQTISLQGDVTGSGTGTFNTTISNTTVVAGSYTNSNITVNSQGRITTASSGTVQPITLTGDVTGTGTSTINVTLSPSGVAAGTYGSSTEIPVITVDVKGRVTAVSQQPVIAAIVAELYTIYSLNGTPVTLVQSMNNVGIIDGVSANTNVTLPTITSGMRTLTFYCPISNNNINWVAPAGGTIKWEFGLAPTLSSTTEIIILFSSRNNIWYGTPSYGYI